MISFRLPNNNTPHLTSFIHRYLNVDPVLSSFYNNPPTLEGIKKQIQEKKFSAPNRKVLHKTLSEQYSGISLSEPVQKNLNSLINTKTFTVTTGHQPNFCTGPLYVLIKIAFVIKLANVLNEKLNDYHFVPVYWLNSEDHDKEELNHFFIGEKKFTWETNQSGAFGEFVPENLNTFFQNLLDLFPEKNKHLTFLKDCHTNSKTVSEAMRKIINHLFGEDGLIIIDSDSKDLKKEFENVISEELENSVTQNIVMAQNKILSEFVEPPVNPREINLFWMENNLRERIVKNSKGDFQVLNSEIHFTQDEIKKIINDNPEHFSPNVLLRPLYQEMVLPNVVFAGGTNEITYWMQLKNLFNYFHIPFPVLMVRNSFTLINTRVKELLEKHDIEFEKLFPLTELKNQVSEKENSFQTLFSEERNEMTLIYERIRKKLVKYDKNLERTVEGEKLKTFSGLDHFEQKVRKVWESQNRPLLKEIDEIINWISPEKILQERIFNFLTFTEITPEELCRELINHSEPFDYRHIILDIGNKG